MNYTGAHIRIEDDVDSGVTSPSVGKESEQEASLSAEKLADDGANHEPVESKPLDMPEPMKEKRPKSMPEKEERCVVVSGNDHQIYRAEFWIYQRIAETMSNYIHEVFLTSEMYVYPSLIGRIIGKNGQNVNF